MWTTCTRPYRAQPCDPADSMKQGPPLLHQTQSGGDMKLVGLIDALVLVLCRGSTAVRWWHPIFIQCQPVLLHGRSEIANPPGDDVPQCHLPKTAWPGEEKTRMQEPKSHICCSMDGW